MSIVSDIAWVVLFFTNFVLPVIFACSSPDYCAVAKKYCQGDPHVACPYPMLPPNCYGFSSITMSYAQRYQILKLHNRLRNKIALGKEDKGKGGTMPIATAMRYMNWDDDLEYLASLNLITYCASNHDKCRATEEFPSAGQNLAMSGKSGEHYNIDRIIDVMINKWYNEVNNTDLGQIDSYTGSDDPNAAIGHFTQMVRDVSGYVGCAAAQYTTGNMYRTLLTCDYEMTNMKGQPVYKKGERAASACPKRMRKSREYPGLCAADKILSKLALILVALGVLTLLN